jgi:urea transport system ATP-binding protein
MGRNGVGKTTMLKALMGTLKVRTGSILFDGADMTTMPPHQRARAGIGYVPQGRGIFPYLTVFENLCMGFESVPGARIDPDGIDRMYATFPILKQMSRRVAGTLSGGQQQQLAIARALVRRPRLLLLDEPTEGIQPSIMHEIEDVIVSLQQQGDMAILLVEQFVDFALGVAEHFYVMQTGRIVAEGAVRDFRQEIAKEYLTF